MNDHADAAELLAIARSTLLNDILPGLPPEQRYRALMIANAMAIAAREHVQGEVFGRAELTRLGELLKQSAVATTGAALNTALADCNRSLCSAIRAGRFDGSEGAALLDHLKKTAVEKLTIANPKALNY